MEENFDTLAVRAGQVRSQFNEHAEALYLTSSFVFRSAAEAAARFSGAEPGNVYARFTNPTVTTLQERLGVHFHDDDFDGESFRTVGTLTALVGERLAHA